MSARLLVMSAVVMWVGLVLVLAETRWFRQRSLSSRLGTYVPELDQHEASSDAAQSLRSALAPVASWVADRTVGVLGVSDNLEMRLHRVHSTMTPSEFRFSQAIWTLAAGVGAVVLFVVVRPPVPLVVLGIVAAMALAFLWREQQLLSRCDRWQRRVFLELPVVAEQLAMLTSAGYSLGGALSRVGERGDGAVSQDLARVMRWVGRGSTYGEALREWQTIAALPEVDRLVAVLVLNEDGAELSALISEEARSTRRAVHRELLASMEKRSQQVWIPVTVATLVPGAIFVAVPFLQALQFFSGS
jgi:Flp pilus assembly protein TadB